ncbi:D-alanine--D-alanine ligase [Heracleum sosnowskyi]|uniref:D-alanine--D-alanine ligase n=1 Tax=Heracleum sosnowskyi TaxID=360622 RepID=A0AAD8N3U2_9APIA|nr:D-alanine--D-alanine ligase [Heracleum sosnowskyi]
MPAIIAKSIAIISDAGLGMAMFSLCMFQFERSSAAYCHCSDFGVLTINKDVRSKEDLLNMPIISIWNELTSKLQCETLCVKPARDGCSTGVARLCSSDDFAVYVKSLKDCLLRIPPNSFSKAHGMIEMPNPTPDLLIFEPFIETDEILISSQSTNVSKHGLLWEGHSRWIEVTVGVVGNRGSMRSPTPSITVKESGDLYNS